MSASGQLRGRLRAVLVTADMRAIMEKRQVGSTEILVTRAAPVTTLSLTPKGQQVLNRHTTSASCGSGATQKG